MDSDDKPAAMLDLTLKKARSLKWYPSGRLGRNKFAAFGSFWKKMEVFASMIKCENPPVVVTS